MAWYDPISVIINLVSKKPTPTQWYAAFQSIIDKIQGLTLESLQRSDITTNDANTLMHGLMPKNDGIVTHFYRSDGTQAVPPGGVGIGGSTGSVAAAILIADGVDSDTMEGSGITIATPLEDNDTTVPTGKAVQDAIDTATSTLSGKITGPASAVDGNIPVFDLTTGKLVKDSSTNLATLESTVSSKAPLASPVLTGTPEAPTAANGTSTTQIATTAFVQNAFSYLDALVYKGAIDCSENPNYPAANGGDTYKVSGDGKIGGASGVTVVVGDMFICCVDDSSAGTQAEVGANWNVLSTNMEGVVIGPASCTSGNLVVFDGTTGKLVKDGGTLSAGWVLASASDTVQKSHDASFVTYVNVDEKDLIVLGIPVNCVGGGSYRCSCYVKSDSASAGTLSVIVEGITYAAWSITTTYTARSIDITPGAGSGVGVHWHVTRDNTDNITIGLVRIKYDTTPSEPL